MQEDQEAAVGAELVLEALRTQACREESTAVVNPWEEVDSQAVVLGPKNEVGGASEVIQRPGQVLALQVGLLFLPIGVCLTRVFAPPGTQHVNKICCRVLFAILLLLSGREYTVFLFIAIEPFFI